MLRITVQICFFVFFPATIFCQAISINSNSKTRPILSVPYKSDSGIKELNEQEGKKQLALFMILINGEVAKFPVSGKYILTKDSLFFQSHFDLEPGRTFEAQVYNGTMVTKKRITIPKTKTKPTKENVVKQFYPVTDTIPQNILRFHVEFSEPMMKDEMAFMQVKILNASGKEIKMMWRHKSYWINERILVLMIHPGRVKQGIKNYSELGPLFKKDSTYTLLVGKNIKDIHGRNLSKEYSRKFVIGERDTVMPTILPNINSPAADTNWPITISFSDKMDLVSLIEGIKVENKLTGKIIEGEFKMFDWDDSIYFLPLNKWVAAEYNIVFTKVVSDLAFNYLHRPFEIRDLKNLNEGKMPMVRTITIK